MIDKDLLNTIKGNGPMIAGLQIAPIERILLRANIIFDLTSNKKVLHLGCADHMEAIKDKINNGTHLHQQLSRIAAKYLGIDINKEAVEYLASIGINNIILSDITKPGIKEITDNHWDYLLMPEVLEHIDNPVAFLREIGVNYKCNIDRGIIITVPNAFGYIHMIDAINNGVEVINSDHRYWFTPYTLCKVVYQAGLEIDDLTMCSSDNMTSVIDSHMDMLMQKPILLDTIVLMAHYRN